MAEPDTESSGTVADIERSPRGIVRRWLAELELAGKAEQEWRKSADELIKLYRGEKTKADSFNIVWSNTDTLVPALYNSRPEPDVRRRFRDRDPVGKAAADVLERTLSHQLDAQDVDDVSRAAVFDLALLGRGVLRERYEPVFSDVLPQAPDAADPVASQRVVDETVTTQHVQWRDFRRGPGRRWEDVNWVAFRHDFTRDMATERFGPEIAAKLTYAKGEETGGLKDRDARLMFETCEVWEVWDKEQRRVLFVSESWNDQPCLLVADPLRLQGFFPCPRPAYAVLQSDSLVPVTLFSLYREQAKELDRISSRINTITRALRVRGAYSANLPELKHIIEAGDDTMVPLSNISELAAMGGIEKAVWIMPTEQLIAVLNGLYVARDQAKQVIYEITGLSDIMRGATAASETATAQRIKNQWGTLRLQRMQRDVQRLLRDILRIKAEIICDRFGPETLAAQSLVELPTGEQKMQAQMMAQRMVTGGMPVPVDLRRIVESPSWDEVMAILRNDLLRSYRVDIETDSTVADTMDRDAAGMSEVVQALGSILTSTGSAVQAGMLPPAVPKQVALAVVRRMRLGSEIEDAIEMIPDEAPMAPQGVGNGTDQSVVGAAGSAVGAGIVQ